MQKILRRSIAVPLAILALAGCSSKGKMPCSEYGELEYSERTRAVESMIRDHGLRPYSNAWGLAAVQQDVNDFCGVGLSLPGHEHPATTNVDSAIEDAVDWEAYTE